MTIRWLLPKEERQRMMNDHFKIGHDYPSVKINTTYSFGLDDQEFVVAFETDDEGGLPMVDVGDYGDVSYIRWEVLHYRQRDFTGPGASAGERWI